jgi:hypothetical protein
MMIPHPGYGYIITLDSGIPPNIQQYMITIGTFPNCSCPYFKEMVTKALGKQGQWANCKYLYFIFTVICRLDAEVDDFIHAPTLEENCAICNQPKNDYGHIQLIYDSIAKKLH